MRLGVRPSSPATTDFFRKSLCHDGYCLAVLNTTQYEVAAFARRFLRHPDFDTQAKRMGKVVKLGPTGIAVWAQQSGIQTTEPWPRTKRS